MYCVEVWGESIFVRWSWIECCDVTEREEEKEGEVGGTRPTVELLRYVAAFLLQSRNKPLRLEPRTAFLNFSSSSYFFSSLSFLQYSLLLFPFYFVSSSLFLSVIFCPVLFLQSSITDHAGVSVCLVFRLLVGFWCARCRLIGEGQINVAALCGECLMGQLWIFDEKERMRELYMETESCRYGDWVRVALSSRAWIVDVL